MKFPTLVKTPIKIATTIKFLKKNIFFTKNFYIVLKKIFCKIHDLNFFEKGFFEKIFTIQFKNNTLKKCLKKFLFFLHFFQ
jgi:hypothetical protein